MVTSDERQAEEDAEKEDRKLAKASIPTKTRKSDHDSKKKQGSK